MDPLRSTLRIWNDYTGSLLLEARISSRYVLCFENAPRLTPPQRDA